MSNRTDIQSILTRALLTAAAVRAHRAPRAGAPRELFPDKRAVAGESLDLTMLSEQAHRLLADLITLLLLELEGLVQSPLNKRSLARVRLGMQARSRVLAEWSESLKVATEGELFVHASMPPVLPIARDPAVFFDKVLDSARATAAYLELGRSSIEEMVRWLMPVVARCSPEDDPVGWLHAHARRHQLVFGPGDRLRFQVDRASSRSHGVLYTPPPLTEMLVEAILSSWTEEKEPTSASLFELPSRTAAHAPRILDPSCGSGQFLLSIARHLLADRKGRPEEILNIFRGLHGVDIDPAAATLAAFNLSLQAVRAVCTAQEADPPVAVDWIESQLGPGFPWFLGSQIHQGNALLLATTQEGTAFRWTDRFAEIFTGDRPGFDIVIGNPPWVSYGLRDRAGPEEEASTYLRRLYTFGAQYKLSLCPLFIELALRLTRPGGLHGFLVPDSFFTGRHFSRIRAHILETCHPILICLVEAGPWPGVHVGHTAFYCVRRLPAPDQQGDVTTCVVQFPSSARHRRKRPSITLSLFGRAMIESKPVCVSVSTFRSAPYQSFRIYREERDRRFVETIEKNPMRFDELVDTYSGLIARFGQKSVTGPRPGEYVLRDLSGKVLVRDPQPGTRWRASLHSGAEVYPFHVRWRRGALYIPEDHDLLRRIYKSGFALQRYTGPKVFLRQTGDRLVAARDQEGLLCLNNVHILTAREEPRIDMRFLCGFLLSDTIQRYYQAIALEAGRPLAQVDLATVRTLPFPCDPDGVPYGQLLADPETREIVEEACQMVDQALNGRGIDRLLHAIQESVRGEGSPSARRSHRTRVTAIVSRLVEILEGTDGQPAKREARVALDRTVEILFHLEEENPDGEVSSHARRG